MQSLHLFFLTNLYTSLLASSNTKSLKISSWMELLSMQQQQQQKKKQDRKLAVISCQYQRNKKTLG